VAALIGFSTLSLEEAAASNPPTSNAPAKFVQPMGVFNSLEFATNASAGTDQWNKALKRMDAEKSLYKSCDDDADSCPNYLAAWRRDLKEWKHYGTGMQLELVNAYVNHQIHYTADEVAFGEADHWATPAESFKGQGDCEDYAIAKYASLRELGYADKDLRIVIVNDMRKNLGHAVLSVTTADGTMILDNQNALPRRDASINYYAPLYSLNAGGHWLNIATRALKTVPTDAVASNDVDQSSMQADKFAKLGLHPTLIASDLAPAADLKIVAADKETDRR